MAEIRNAPLSPPDQAHPSNNLTCKFPRVWPIVVIGCVDNSEVKSSMAGVFACQSPRDLGSGSSTTLGIEFLLSHLRAKNFRDADRHAVVLHHLLELGRGVIDGIVRERPRLKNAHQILFARNRNEVLITSPAMVAGIESTNRQPSSGSESQTSISVTRLVPVTIATSTHVETTTTPALFVSCRKASLALLVVPVNWKM